MSDIKMMISSAELSPCYMRVLAQHIIVRMIYLLLQFRSRKSDVFENTSNDNAILIHHNWIILRKSSAVC